MNSFPPKPKVTVIRKPDRRKPEQTKRVEREMKRVESARVKLRWRITRLERALACLTAEVHGENTKPELSSDKVGSEK